MSEIRYHSEIVRQQEREWQDELSRIAAESRKSAKARRVVVSQLRPATSEDYQRFLDARDEPCSHFYDYDMPDRFYVAVSNVEIPPLCGSQAIYVIAMPGVTVKHSGPTWATHCEIYRIDEPDSGCAWVPSYNNAHQHVTKGRIIE